MVQGDQKKKTKQKKKTEPINFITSTKIQQNNSNFIHSNMLVNTVVPIFHAQNLLHIQKKRKG